MSKLMCILRRSNVMLTTTWTMVLFYTNDIICRHTLLLLRKCVTSVSLLRCSKDPVRKSSGPIRRICANASARTALQATGSNALLENAQFKVLADKSLLDGD